mgnify:CR=1 FL=1
MDIIIVDDHSLTRTGIGSILEPVSDFRIVGEAPDASTLFDQIQKRRPSLVLLDINLPDMNGVEVAEKVKTEHPNIKLIVVTMHDEDAYIEKMVRTGVDGYVLKDTSHDELIQAIRIVAKGGKYFTPKVTETIMMKYVDGETATTSDNASHELTPREMDIIKCVSRELSNREIAEELSISVRTVENHKRNLFQKLGVRNSVGLVRYAFEHDLLD